MSRNHQIYVERQSGQDDQAMSLAAELRSVLHLPDLEHIRLISLYEISGLEECELYSAAAGILYEAPTDRLLTSFVPHGRFIAREYLPGQFDQRADSAQRCLRLLWPERDIEVKRADIFVLSGRLGDDAMKKIRSWLINPVDSRPKDLKNTSLGKSFPDPLPITSLTGFISKTREDLDLLRSDFGLALNTDDLAFIRDWFAEQESRDPTLAELRALDTYWSDHCRHTTFETELKSIRIAEGGDSEDIAEALSQWDEARTICGRLDRPKTLMDLATVAAGEAKVLGLVDDWDVSEEINACTLKVDARIDGKNHPWLLSFKNETHNHPTEIEPYGGASTCLGGAVRDPLSGRAYVHQALRVTGGADPRRDAAQTRPGKLPQRFIAQVAAEGYAGYGNQLGLACAVVREHYHPGYEAKRLECGAVMGASPADHVVRGIPDPGDVVILVGGRTGRDGIGGATGSSVAHDGRSLEKAGAEVQKGNAPEERKLQRLFRNPEAAGLIRRCNDFGAGGVAVAVGELADGLLINLDALPVKYQGLNGLELALSESQERMAVVVRSSDAASFIQFAEAENLEAVAAARVTASHRLQMTWKGEMVIDLHRRLLDTNGVRRKARAVIPADCTAEAGFPDAVTAENLLKHLSSPAVASRRGLMERFDGSVGGTTVLAPHGGVRQATPAEASVHLLPADGDVETAGIMSVGFDPDLAEISPFRGGQAALIEALARICAAGGSWRRTRFSLQEFFGRTDRGEESWGAPLAALLGALTVQRRWGLPAIGGKDSMSGSFEDLDVPPTLIAFAAGTMDTGQAVGAALPAANLTVALTGPFRPSGGKSAAPDFDGLESAWDWLESMNKRNRVKAAASVGPGGWASKLVMMALGNGIGFELDETTGKRPFASDYGSLIVASDLSPKELRRDAENAGASVHILGCSIADPMIRWTGGEWPLAQAEQAWREPFADVWPEDDSEDHLETAEPLSTRSTRPPGPPGNPLPSENIGPSLGGGRPRVCIPVFPGTNGEDDARRAFLRAGAKPMEHIFLDRDAHKLDEALSHLAADINRSQILYLSGGFSAGDEPDGAGKYIAAILRHERIADAVRGLLDRDGLILGICNGFQALIKSGWLINGSAGVPGAHDPTLVRNRIGRHVARIVRTVATESSSPWMSLIRPKDMHSVPVSHGEGRFSASPELLARLEDEGRIPFRYCDMEGRPTMAGEFNPNGSAGAVEALLSPCGRILGKMGHSERWRKGTYIDIPGMEAEQPLIKGGVSWFI